jgi:hypothetical protein
VKCRIGGRGKLTGGRGYSQGKSKAGGRSVGANIGQQLRGDDMTRRAGAVKWRRASWVKEREVRLCVSVWWI